MAAILRLVCLLGFVLGQDIPAPLEITPSGYWDGNDGPWSTFTIGIGSPPQAIRVLPAAAQSVVTVIMAEDCADTGYAGGFHNCSDMRGGVFRSNESRSWKSNGVHDVEIAQDMGLGIKRTFLFGTDTVGLGVQPQASRMSNQTVAGMKGLTSSFTGAMGISPKAFNMTPDQAPVPTFFESLSSSTRIASRSWSYTAGSVTRKVFGSLVLGGFDAGRINDKIAKPLSIKMTNDTLRELSVSLQGINVSEGTKAATTMISTQVMKTPLNIPIEPLISRIWLPTSVCQGLEKALGLDWNSTAQLYFITDEQHASLLARNVNIIFTISDPLSKAQTTDITFAYADLALTATYPLTDHTGRYFPFQRAYRDEMIVLGRAFLQAAYLTADYDRNTLNVSQANLDANSEKRIYTIMPPVLPSSSNTTSNAPSSTPYTSSGTSRSTMGPGPIAGIVSGVAICISALILGLFLYRRRHTRTTLTRFELGNETREQSKISELAVKGRGGTWELEGSHGVSEMEPTSAASELAGDRPPVELEANEKSFGGASQRLENERKRMKQDGTSGDRNNEGLEGARRPDQDDGTKEFCDTLVRHKAWTFPSTP